MSQEHLRPMRDRAKCKFAAQRVIRDRVSQLFRGAVSFADALRKSRELSEERGFDGLYEIDDGTSSNGDKTFLTLEAWQNALREIYEQLGPLKARSGLNWSSGQAMPVAGHQRVKRLGDLGIVEPDKGVKAAGCHHDGNVWPFVKAPPHVRHRLAQAVAVRRRERRRPRPRMRMEFDE